MKQRDKKVFPVTSLIILVLVTVVFSQNVKRGRNEGTFNIPASNVQGNGNISLFTTVNGHYNSNGFGSDPSGRITVGIADILQFSGQLSLTNFSTLGTAQAEAQITTPKNNRLRFIGLAFKMSLFLSTSIDTISNTAASGKPEYHSYLRPSLILDFDWLAKNKELPLKTYIWAGMYDNQDLLFKYNQLSFKSGLEWKLMKHSIFLDIGCGLYKEVKSPTFSGDKKFEQFSLWMEPGSRYRIFNRISVLSSLRVLLVQKVRNKDGLTPNYVKLSLGAELPLIYRETNTEAIRTMIFVEKEKEKEKDIIARSIESGKKVRTDFELNFEDLDQKSSLEEDEQAAIKQREELSKKMDEIERILESLDE
jgi:hypothetical protein